MRKELRRQIELLEQKMSKSPNNIKDGGSHFLYHREQMIRFKMLQKNMPQKILAKRLNLTKSYIFQIHHRRMLYFSIIASNIYIN